jgi:hypothetical protein
MTRPWQGRRPCQPTADGARRTQRLVQWLVRIPVALGGKPRHNIIYLRGE